MHKHTAASISTSPDIRGQHSFAAGSPSPICTSPPRRSTHAPSFNESIGHVSGSAEGGGQGVPLGGFTTGGSGTTGGNVGTFGTVTGGTGTLGTVTGGSTGTLGTVTGGTGTLGMVIGGLTMGGVVVGGLGVLGCGLG